MHTKRNMDLEYVRLQVQKGLATPEVKDKFQKDTIKRVLKENGISLNFIVDSVKFDYSKFSRCLNSSFNISLDAHDRALLKKEILNIAKELTELSEIIEFQPTMDVEKLKMIYGDSVNEEAILKSEKSFNEYSKRKYNIDFELKGIDSESKGFNLEK